MNTFVVFGGSKGIGGVLSERLLESGNRVIVVARSCAKTHKNLDFISADLSEESGCKRACDEILSRKILLSGLVFAQRFRGDSQNEWSGEIEATLHSFKIGVDSLKDLIVKGGAIVAVSSNAARLVTPNQPASYHMAKAGLEALVRYYALLLGSAKIRVNAIAPVTTIKPENEEFYRKNPELTELYVRTIPLQEMCRAEYVCEAIEFFLRAPHVTGQVLDIDGGMGLVIQDSLVKEIFGLDDTSLRR